MSFLPKKLSHWLTVDTKIRPGISIDWRIFESNRLSISSQFESNILQLLEIPGRILVPPVTQLFRSKWLHFFSVLPKLRDSGICWCQHIGQFYHFSVAKHANQFEFEWGTMDGPNYIISQREKAITWCKNILLHTILIEPIRMGMWKAYALYKKQIVKSV